MENNEFTNAAAKSWFASYGVTGGLLSAILGAYTAYQTSGQVPPAESAALVAIVISGLISAWGRVTAKRPIKS